MPVVTCYGVCSADLMFFDSPVVETEAPATEVSLTGIVKVTHGTLTEAQVVQQLSELAPGNFQWKLVKLEGQTYKVDFPSLEDLNFILKFGMCRVAGTTCILETPKSEFIVSDFMNYAGETFNDSHPHPTLKMTATEIIEQSSNVGTIQIGLNLGGEKLDEYVRRFGFGEPTGLDFPGESSGIVIDRADWTGPTIVTIPIGQGIAVTPIQMASAYATIANDGVWVEPKLLASTMDGDGNIRRSPHPSTRRVVSAKTAKQMARILTGVTKEGTGIEAQVPGYAVAGKTGTAQKPLPEGGYGNSYVGSFAGFVPSGRPEIVVLVVLDEPSPIWGGSTAAPTFKTIAEFALRHLGVSPTGNAEKAAEAIEADQAGEELTYD